jgi:hypothetical protein
MPSHQLMEREQYVEKASVLYEGADFEIRLKDKCKVILKSKQYH